MTDQRQRETRLSCLKSRGTLELEQMFWQLSCELNVLENMALEVK